MVIALSELVVIPKDSLHQYKLHLASWNGSEQPLDVFVSGWENWVGWNEWKGNKDDFSREYIFSLIEFYPEPNKWLFGGIFHVVKQNKQSYEVKLEPKYQALIGRLLIDFFRYRGMRGRAFYLENYFDKLIVSEILRHRYDGTVFPGFENINLTFSELFQIINTQRKDWHAALKNVKAVYAVFDTSNGKKYIGSAYGDLGLWARWAGYIETGHGWNDELKRLIDQKGMGYARENFRFCVLEHRPMRTDDSIIIERESYWKNVLLSRGRHGYNKN